jgi:hypothetical protein
MIAASCQYSVIYHQWYYHYEMQKKKKKKKDGLYLVRGAYLGRDKTCKADISNFGNKIVVDEDIGGFKVAVDKRLRLRLVQKEESCSNLKRYFKPYLPWNGHTTSPSEQPVLQAPIVHIFIHQAPVLGTSSK